MSPLRELPVRSRSGLRPGTAFVTLGIALIVVVARVAHLAIPEPQPARALRAAEPVAKALPRYGLSDRHGAPLAISHATFALEASPYNLFLAHTPEVLEERLGAALDLNEREFEALWNRLLGLGNADALRVSRWPLTAEEAVAIGDWLAGGGPAAKVNPDRTAPDGAHAGILRGLWIEPFEPRGEQLERVADLRGPFFQLAWRPDILLARVEREAQWPALAERRNAASTWVRALGSDLHRLLAGPLEREARSVGARAEPADRAADRATTQAAVHCLALGADPARAHRNHECVFSGLLPKRFAPLLDPVPSAAVPALRGILQEERIGPHALWLRASATRVYPAGDMKAVGSWGWSGAPGESEPVPMPGLERLVNAELAELEALGGVRLREGISADIVRRTLLARRPGLQRGYYLEHTEPSAPAVVESTLDLELMRFVGARLEQTLADSQAASAMAIVLDLDTREVLALDWRDNYRTTLWAPLQRLYTPGSTWKLVTMALALEGGLIRPTDVLDVGAGQFRLRNDEGRVVRTIGEAEGYKSGRLTAAECVAHSSNAGMVQIGTRIAPAVWKRTTRELGYGIPTAPELAGEFYNPPGQVGEAEGRGGRAWSLGRNLASVSFGDSISLNLLQHAAGLAALVGGGEWRPLVFTRAVHTGGKRFDLPRPAGRRIVSARTSATLVDMCRLGAEEGTGKSLLRPADFHLGTKTGTTEKLRNDVCSHVWGAAYEAALESGAPWNDAAEYARYRGRWGDGRRSCYVSSIAAFARSADGSRRLFTLVVVDDPHAKGRPFGSRHAGPAAVDILAEGLGYTVGGDAPLATLADGLWPMRLDTLNPSVAPWLEPVEQSYARFADFEGFRGHVPAIQATPVPSAAARAAGPIVGGSVRGATLAAPVGRQISGGVR